MKKVLRGEGVKVVVIDSGVDADHDGFNGRVSKQMRFRYGTLLSSDDRGTHGAGRTIQMLAPPDAKIHDCHDVFGA